MGVDLLPLVHQPVMLPIPVFREFLLGSLPGRRLALQTRLPALELGVTLDEGLLASAQVGARFETSRLVISLRRRELRGNVGEASFALGKTRFPFAELLVALGKPQSGRAHLVVQFRRLGLLLGLAPVEILPALFEQLGELPPLQTQPRQQLNRPRLCELVAIDGRGFVTRLERRRLRRAPARTCAGSTRVPAIGVTTAAYVGGSTLAARVVSDMRLPGGQGPAADYEPLGMSDENSPLS